MQFNLCGLVAIEYYGPDWQMERDEGFAWARVSDGVSPNSKQTLIKVVKQQPIKVTRTQGIRTESRVNTRKPVNS